MKQGFLKISVMYTLSDAIALFSQWMKLALTGVTITLYFSDKSPYV